MKSAYEIRKMMFLNIDFFVAEIEREIVQNAKIKKFFCEKWFSTAVCSWEEIEAVGHEFSANGYEVDQINDCGYIKLTIKW